MNFFDTIKEFFGGAASDVVQNVTDNVPGVSDVQQNVEQAQQAVGDATAGVGEQVGQQVENLTDKLPK